MKKLLLFCLLFSLLNKGFSQGAPACPQVTTTGATICQGQTATLTSTLVTNNQTTSYNVISIPYSPYAFTGGTGVSVGTDDVWSPVVNLGFNFCFFGNTFSSVIIGSNGVITFNTGSAGSGSGYYINAGLPTTANSNTPGNSICGVFRDIDPTSSGTVKYYLTGTSPCRALVVYFKNVPLFGTEYEGCTTAASTFQMVLYENTNYIDVYVQNSSACTAWNSGYGIIGIQNATSTTAVCPPGRNMGAWSAINEAWRFVPSGATSHTFNWSGPSLSTTSQTATVSPSTTSTYTATMVITNCDASTLTFTSTAVVNVTPSPAITVNSPSACGGTPASLNVTGAATSYAWTPATGLSGTSGSSVTASPASTTVYSVTATTGGCSTTIPATVTVVPNPTVTVNAATVCSGTSATFTANGASTYVWSPPTGLSATTGNVVTSTSTSSITYSVTGTTSGCSKTSTAVLTVNPVPVVTVTSPSICAGTAATIGASGATSYSWSNGMSGASISVTPTVTTSYTVTGTSLACTGTAVATVYVTNIPKLIINDVTICPGGTATLSVSGGTTYTWSTGANGNSISVSPGSTQTYTVTGSIGSCTSNTLATVTVGSGVAITVLSQTICAGDATTLTASGASTYTWSPATGLSSTSGTSVTANPTSTQTYVITGASGVCTGTTTAVVTVNPKPTVTVPSATICTGNSTILTASGASSYAWSPGTGLSGTTGTSVTANPTTSTPYTITGTSVSGCTNTATANVTVNPLPVITVNNPTICTGGTAALTASGASTYTWSTGATTAGISVSPTGTQVYTVTGTSAAGCTATATSTVAVVTTPTVTVASATICIGSNTILTASGASTYVWSPAAGLSGTTGTSVTANPTSTTTYTIVGTAGTCTASGTAVVTVNPLPIITVPSATICVGNSTTLTASGASTYSWTPATTVSPSVGTTVTAIPTSTQIYTITGTSAAGCVNTGTTSVTVNPLPTVTVNNPTICTGGTAVLTPSGASTYSWSTGATTSGISVSPASTQIYTVTGTTSSCTSTATSTVTVVTTPTVTVASATICVGSSTTLTASGASTYVWSPAAGLSSTTGASVTASPTTTTPYTIVGTAGSCTASATANVTVNPLPILSIITPTICSGNSSLLTASGASTYTWSTGPNTNTISVTPPGNTSYTVMGTNANGCTNFAVGTVSVSASVTVTVNDPIICTGFTTTLTASGATSYSWNTGSTAQTITVSPMVTTSYTVTGSENGCTGTEFGTVTVVTNPTVTVSSATVCIHQGDTLTASGASHYVWSPSTGLSSTTTATVIANPTVTTTYTVVGTAGTCTATGTGQLTVNPLPIITVPSATICAGNSTTLTASGASTYTWIPSTTVSPSTGNPVTANPTSTQIYTITGTSVLGCTNTATSAVTVNPLPTVTVNNPTICNGSTAVVTATGSATYSWNTGASTASISVSPTSTQTYVVTGTTSNCTATATSTVTVVNNPVITVSSATVCVGSSAVLTASGGSTYSWTPATGLSATTGTNVVAQPTITETYSVVGTVGTCTAIGSGVLTVNPLPIITATSGTICIGQQTATLTASGGVSYTWSPPATLTPTVGTSVNANPTTTQNYTVTGTDANGCVNTGTAHVTVNPLPIITANSGTICIGQQTTILTANGGTSYVWSPSTGLSGTTNPSEVANPSATTIYTITGTDVHGCVNTGTASVLVNQLPTVTATSTSVCPGFAGTLTAGGASTYTWSTGVHTYTLTQTPTITTGYTVNATDVNTCTNTAVGTITVFPTLTVTVNSASICIGQQTATLTANGAVNYNWSPTIGLSPVTGGTVNASPNVTTIYTVTGVVGTCSATATSTVTVNPLPTITATSAVICLGEQTATLTASGGVSYTWTPSTGLGGITGPTVTGMPPATQTYVVTGTDANGCTNTASTIITVLQLPTITATSVSVCPGVAGTITSGGAGGTGTYAWVTTPVVTGSVLTETPIVTTTYSVIGTDQHGCYNGATGTITVYNTFSISVNSATICAAGQQVATLTATGASTYVWSPVAGISSNVGSSVTSLSSAVNTLYTIIGTSSVGSCTASTTASLTVNALPQPVATSNAPCANQQALMLNCTPNNLSSYIWNGPNSYTASGSSQNIPFSGVTTALAGIYTVTVIDNNTPACTNTTVVNVTINAIPIVTVSVSPVCIGQTIDLTAVGGVTYSWSHSSETPPFSSSQNPLLRPNATLAMAGNYVVTATDANGCVGAGFATAVVNTLPVITATTNAICTGQQTSTLTATGATTYTWSGSYLTLPNANPTNANPTITSVYNVFGTDANNCVSTATTSITVYDLPIVTTNSVAPDCVPLCHTFIATSTPTASTYSWNFGNGASSTQPAPTECYTVAGTSRVVLTVTDINGCVSAASTSVTAFGLPTAAFEYGPQPVSILAPEVQFTNGSSPGLNYTWNFGDIYNNTDTVTNPSHMYSNAGDYTVTLTASSATGCSATTHEVVHIFDDYAVYVPNAFTPNGDGENEIFTAVGIGISNFKMYVFDRWGSLIFYSEDITKGWDGTYQAKGTDVLQQDVYVWKIQLKNFRNESKDLNGTVTLIK